LKSPGSTRRVVFGPIDSVRWEPPFRLYVRDDTPSGSKTLPRMLTHV
jgi:hypothetical protein